MKKIKNLILILALMIVLAALRSEVVALVELYTQDIDTEKWNFNEIAENLMAYHADFGKLISRDHLAKMQDKEELKQHLEDMVVKFYEDKCAAHDIDTVARAESIVTLRSIDSHWMDHIDDMSHLREQVAFSGYRK
jgi:preprotein translocase subunit SecA